MRTLEDINDLTNEIKRSLIDKYGDDIKQVIVYRGGATEAADIDMAVIIDDRLNSENVENELSDLSLSFFFQDM